MEAKDSRGQSKEGSSRVGVYRATGLVHCLTIEVRRSESDPSQIRARSESGSSQI